jgi:CRP-like cAMP-binding protein
MMLVDRLHDLLSRMANRQPKPVFFNMLWVFLPLYALYFSFYDLQNAFVMRKGMIAARMELRRREAEAESKKETKKGK